MNRTNPVTHDTRLFHKQIPYHHTPPSKSTQKDECYAILMKDHKTCEIYSHKVKGHGRYKPNPADISASAIER